ncbi:gastrula zinc finger protein xFG20-1-like [Diaphorina citri]|uniref:Gastrula zinc finger protein xFG20-1-like n=1 Tax=Diaphorina citri TaxID=121845 RepID=A0A3Q0J8V9_DIACI|nr:gastrula zinc finger protein xFG20-1-like [Diaphorina citri]
MFACDVCGKEYKYKRGLYRHKKFECGQEPKYQCPHCPHRAKHKANLKTHIAVKHFAKYFLAALHFLIITSSLSVNNSFAAMYQNCSGTYPCDACDKVYQYKGNLDRHKRDECGQEPKYACPHCPYKSKHKANLKSHIGIRH